MRGEASAGRSPRADTMTASPAAAARGRAPSQSAGVVATFSGRIKGAVRRRAGRFEWMLIVFVMLFPALATAVLAGR
jgi:hypothetical protein